MINDDRMIEKLKINIAIANFKDEKNTEEYTLKKGISGRLYEMKKKIAIFIVGIMLISGTVFAFDQFSGLNEDDLSISATYEGNGKISIYIENNSNKVVDFEKKIKLMRWSSGEEIKAISDKLKMSNTKIEPNSNKIMKIDISKMYDLSEIEKPLDNDHYYFVLTNNNFIFGNDWHCSIDFNKDDNIEKEEITYVDKAELDSSLTNQNTFDELEQFYKEWIINPEQRNQKVEEYYKKVYEILE